MFTKLFSRVWMLAVVALVATGLAIHLRAQTYLTSTTLSSAATALTQTIHVTSATGVEDGDLAVVDREVMVVTDVNSTTLTVRRGQNGTAAAAHLNGALIFIDVPSNFSQVAPAGACTASNERSTPRIVLPSVRFFDCINGRWQERHALPSSFSAAAVFTGKMGARDNFDQGYLVMQDDGTAKSVTDDEDNFVYGSPLGAIEYREELTKTASSWVTSAGRLDLSADDTTDDEGVEIIVGASELDGSYFVAGTTGACISASITITDISGTDQVLIGFRDSSAFLDVNNYGGYTIWNVVGVNNVDGSIVSLQEVSEATDSDDSGVNWADGETRVLKLCVTAAGVPSAYYSNAVTLGSQAEQHPVFNAITMTETGGTLTAAQAMVPFVTYMAAGTDGADVFINWLQLEPHH